MKGKHCVKRKKEPKGIKTSPHYVYNSCFVFKHHVVTINGYQEIKNNLGL
jgi:hypothetical protein